MTVQRGPKFKAGDRVVFCHLDRIPWPENTMASMVFVVVSYSVDRLGDEAVFYYTLVNETPTEIPVVSISSLVSEENLMEAPSLAWDQEAI